MTSKYQQYTDYKTSGTKWMGNVPAQWNLRKSKFLFQRVQRPVREQDGIVTAFRDGQVTLRSNRRTEGFTTALKEIGYQGVRKGDLLIHAMDGFAGAIGVSDSDGKCSPVCSVCVPRDSHAVDTVYYGYLVRQLATTDFITSLAKGIRERSTEFRYAEFANLELCLPSFKEQQSIANFLDHETAKIDALIEKQQRLIELLKEKRQAVISHAVTKGLNPDLPMKDSGVEWLGEVPENWDVGKIGYFAKVSNGATPSRENLDYWTNGTIPWLNSSKVNDLKIQQADQFITHKAKRETSVAIVKPDDLVVGITGEGQTRGRVAICAIEATINQHLACISVVSLEKVNPLFLYYYLVNSYQRLRDESDGGGATKGAITCVQLHKFPLLSPSLSEQNAICDFLNEALSKLDSLLDEAQHLILLFRERKASLISHAVTGKIDVRNWQSASKEKSHA